jgi:D-glycero-alpha-D-manno-heptose-7-phosphate kinase
LREKGTSIRSRAPLRVSFAGGGTDVSPYPETEGGAVLSTTIDQYAYCNISISDTKAIEVRSHDYDILEIFQGISDLKYNGKLDLIKASLKTLGIEQGFKITLFADAPPGSGLGSSSAIAVALVGALFHNNNKNMSAYEIAETAYKIERFELDIKGGMQDQYASAFGGFNFIEFKKDSVIVNPLRLREEIVNELLASMLLCDTGIRRLSGDIINKQIEGYNKKETDVLSSLRFLKELAYKMKDSLLKGDIINFANMLDESWKYKKNLANSITNSEIEKLYSFALANGAMGGKLLGAGGGGHLLFICDPLHKPSLSKTLKEKGCNIVKFNFDTSGLQTWLVHDRKVIV